MSSWQYLPREAAAVVATLADAVASIHEQGILHLDLKPANVQVDHGNRLKTAPPTLGWLNWQPTPASRRSAAHSPRSPTHIAS